jgi:hypothetical protein
VTDLDLDRTAQIQRLTTNIEQLRVEQRALLHANDQLLSWGIGSATEEIHDRLHAIKNQALTIAARLHSLDAHDDALDAVTGWAVHADLTWPTQPPAPLSRHLNLA